MTDSDVFKHEMSYNHFIVWLILTSLSKSINNVNFGVGERKLIAMTTELNLLQRDTNHFYNADGVFF